MIIYIKFNKRAGDMGQMFSFKYDLVGIIEYSFKVYIFAIKSYIEDIETEFTQDLYQWIYSCIIILYLVIKKMLNVM